VREILDQQIAQALGCVTDGEMGMNARAWKRRECQKADTLPELDATKARQT